MKYRSVSMVKISDIVASILSTLINEAFAYGSYHNLFKVAWVFPIHRSSSQHDFNNNRLISVLPFLNKLLERALHSRVSIFSQKC